MEKYENIYKQKLGKMKEQRNQVRDEIEEDITMNQSSCNLLIRIPICSSCEDENICVLS
jgi:hypothetical protein